RSGISKQTATGKFKESSDGERGALSLGRRAMLGLSGASALGALASLLFHAHRTRSPAPKTQATPSSGGWLAERPGELPFDHDRRILLEAIARQQNFEPVLSRLVLPRSFRVRIADIRKAVAAARVLIADRSHPIEYLPPEGSTVFEVRSSQPPTIAVNAADLPNFASECPEVLLHEIVHLTDPQLA